MADVHRSGCTQLLSLVLTTTTFNDPVVRASARVFPSASSSRTASISNSASTSASCSHLHIFAGQQKQRAEQARDLLRLVHPICRRLGKDRDAPGTRHRTGRRRRKSLSCSKTIPSRLGQDSIPYCTIVFS
ncbi:hypothetical protein B0H12DRAFT_1130888 [Mycena haematopus]|nr:hypothetical protein B0H12DRAFT_1130888 [Mycena haematopus]